MGIVPFAVLVAIAAMVIAIFRPRSTRSIGPFGVVRRHDPGSWLTRLVRLEFFVAGIVLFFIGLVLLGIAIRTELRIDACLDDSGRWNAAAGVCEH